VLCAPRSASSGYCYAGEENKTIQMNTHLSWATREDEGGRHVTGMDGLVAICSSVNVYTHYANG